MVSLPPLHLPIVTVDAFTTERFKGNPAAVVLLTEPLDECNMKKIANEMNLSETAYAMPVDGKSLRDSGKWSLRWLTPTSEVDLCGHATLATSHVIFHENGNTNTKLQFETKSGSLFVEKTGDACYKMDFPSRHVVEVFPKSAIDETSTEAIVKCAKVAAGEMEIDSVHYSPTAKKVLVVVKESYNKSDLLARKINNADLMAPDKEGKWVLGVALTKKGNVDDGKDADGKIFDCVSRYFAPWVGIDEDPATGALHCALGPYWCGVLRKARISTYQCYPKRGAMFGVELVGEDRVHLFGNAVTVMKGTIECQPIVK